MEEHFARGKNFERDSYKQLSKYLSSTEILFGTNFAVVTAGELFRKPREKDENITTYDLKSELALRNKEKRWPNAYHFG